MTTSYILRTLLFVEFTLFKFSRLGAYYLCRVPSIPSVRNVEFSIFIRLNGTAFRLESVYRYMIYVCVLYVCFTLAVLSSVPRIQDSWFAW